MPWASRSSATLPLAAAARIFSAAATAVSAAADADVGQRLRFGLGDLGLRHLGPPHDELFHPRLGLGGKTLGFGLGAGDNGRGLTFGLTRLALELGQHRLRLPAAAEPPRRARP